MAKAREERVAQAATQISERFKQQDANGDGFLAKDEVSERMQRRFAEADKNSDGFLDATEQQTMVQATAQRMGEGGRQRRGGPADGQGRRNRNQ
jgi:Ca2+-binding EF-hand superfamily protein